MADYDVVSTTTSTIAELHVLHLVYLICRLFIRMCPAISSALIHTAQSYSLPQRSHSINRRISSQANSFDPILLDLLQRANLTDLPIISLAQVT